MQSEKRGAPGTIHRWRWPVCRRRQLWWYLIGDIRNLLQLKYLCVCDGAMLITIMSPSWTRLKRNTLTCNAILHCIMPYTWITLVTCMWRHTFALVKHVGDVQFWWQCPKLSQSLIISTVFFLLISRNIIFLTLFAVNLSMLSFMFGAGGVIFLFLWLCKQRQLMTPLVSGCFRFHYLFS